MIDFKHITNKRLMWLSLFIIFLAMPLLASPAFSAPPFKSTLISCPNVAFDICGPFYVVSPQPEPLTNGSVVVSATGILKVKVNDASPGATYEVLMISSGGGQFNVVGSLSTDAFGDGNVNIPLSPDTYASGVILMRDSDGSGPGTGPTGTGTDPRIFSGFVIP